MLLGWNRFAYKLLPASWKRDIPSRMSFFYRLCNDSEEMQTFSGECLWCFLAIDDIKVNKVKKLKS